MADLSVFGLSRNRPAVFEAFDKGRQRRQERSMNQQVMQQNELKLESAQTKQLGEQDQARLNSIVNGALILQGTPEDARLSVVKDRINTLRNEGIPTDDMEEIQEMLEAGDVEGANAAIEEAASLQNQIKGGRKVQRSVPSQLKDADGRTVPGMAITYDDGSTEVVPLDSPEGFDIPEQETPQQKREAQYRDFALRQQTETEEAAVRAFNNSIASGEATDIANAKRKIIPASQNKIKAERLMMLINDFETGGVAQDFQNRFQSFFGYRPANEEEANRLMKDQAMILLASFTGAKSEGEREFVMQMAPNFNLSNEGNARLIQAMIDDSDYQIEEGNAAMQGRDSYDSFLRERVNAAGVKVTSADVVKEFGEDQIAAGMAQTGMTREEFISQAIKEMQAEKTQ